ncbi:hypothetical protein [Azospirillum largimobile]
MPFRVERKRAWRGLQRSALFFIERSIKIKCAAWCGEMSNAAIEMQIP